MRYCCFSHLGALPEVDRAMPSNREPECAAGAAGHAQLLEAEYSAGTVSSGSRALARRDVVM